MIRDQCVVTAMHAHFARHNRQQVRSLLPGFEDYRKTRVNCRSKRRNCYVSPGGLKGCKNNIFWMMEGLARIKRHGSKQTFFGMSSRKVHLQSVDFFGLIITKYGL